MPDDNIYMTPLPENVGDILMTPEKWKNGVIYMYPIQPVKSEWEYLGIYTFLGNQASTDWQWDAVGNWIGMANSMTTEAKTVRIIPRSGSWYQGETGKYRGVLDIKSSVDCSPVGNDWNGTSYGFTSGSLAEAYWKTTSAEINVGSDGMVVWGAYDITGGGDNSGALIFYLYGHFE